MSAACEGNLLTYLSQVPDPRGRMGRRHSLSAMLTAVVCGLLRGSRSYTSLVEWLHDSSVAAVDHHTGLVFRQCRVDENTNQHKAALELHRTLVLNGRVVVGDTLFCQRDLCRQIIDSGGDCFSEVKENQPGLLRDIRM